MKHIYLIVIIIFISGCAVSGTPETLAWANATKVDSEDPLFNCWSQSYKKLNACGGISCMWGVLNFAEQCAKEVGISPKACSFVPNSPISFVQWAKGTCVDVGQPTEECMKTLGKVAKVCTDA
jgi:hypothetical protein